MKALSTRLRLSIDPVHAAVGLYILSMLWWLLFPIISISTGEVKPRGLYVDENALLVNSGSLGFRGGSSNSKDVNELFNFQLVMESVMKIDRPDDHFCSYITGELTSITCRSFVEQEADDDTVKDSVNITQIVVDHPWKARSLEASAIVIPYHSSNALQTLGFTTVLIKKILAADWLSKRIILLLLPLSSCTEVMTYEDMCEIKTLTVDTDSTTNCNLESVDYNIKSIRYSKALSSWLDEYHSINQINKPNKSNNKLRHEGLLRDAYVVDFTAPFITSISAATKGKKESAEDSVEFTEESREWFMSDEVSWENILLLAAGSNGQLPNMDFLTAPLASFPHIAISEADSYREGRWRNKNRYQSSVGGEAYRVREKDAEEDRFNSEGSATICQYFPPSCAFMCRMYFEILSGLIRFSSALTQGPSGLHGQFIRRNIDSLTLRPIRRYQPSSQICKRRNNTGAGMSVRRGEGDGVGVGGEEGLKSKTVAGDIFGMRSDSKESSARKIPRIEESKAGDSDRWAGRDMIRLVSMVEYFLRLSSNLHGLYIEIYKLAALVSLHYHQQFNLFFFSFF